MKNAAAATSQNENGNELFLFMAGSLLDHLADIAHGLRQLMRAML